MSTNTHAFTPGPWEVASDNPRKVIAPKSLNGFDPLTQENLIGGAALHPDAEANARLIAAAPCLLAALEKCREITNNAEDAYELLVRVENIADAAIVKATGKESA